MAAPNGAIAPVPAATSESAVLFRNIHRTDVSLADTFRCLAALPWDQRAPYLQLALAEPHAAVQRAALAALLEGPDRRPEQVVDHFSALLPEVQVATALHRDELLAIARERIVRGQEGRPSAFRMVAVLGDLEHLDLLVLGLGDPSPAIAEVAFAALLAKWRQHLQEQVAGGDGAALHVVRETVAAAVRACALHHVEALGAALVEFGVSALKWFRGALLARIDDPFGRAFATLLKQARADVAASWAVQLVLDPMPALQRLGERTLRDRTDDEFGLGVAAAVAAVANGGSERAIERLSLPDAVPWWPRAEGLLARLATTVACRLVTVVASLQVDVAERQRHLERFLVHTDGAVQASAVRALHTLGCPTGFAAIGDLLRQGTPAGQRAALQLVLDLSPPDRIALVAPLLGSADEALRELARQEIGKVSFQRFLACFDGMDQHARTVAGRALTKIDPRLLDRLAREVDALEPNRRLLALRILEVLEPGSDLRQRLRELLEDPDQRVRATAIRIVALAESEAGMQTLLAALADPDRRIRANAIEAFEEHGDRAFVPVLVPFLRDPDNRVRANAAKALWTLGWSDARDELFDMLEDPSEAVRISAAWALGQIRCAGARAALVQRAEAELVGRVRVKLREVLSTWPPQAVALLPEGSPA
jgi:hypothetical protein